MFCGNCGAEIGEGIVICPNCGKSKSEVLASNKNGYPLSSLTAKLFKVFFEIALWIVLILGFIIGGTLGNIRNNVFGGLLLGGIASFVLIIIMGGLVSIFININNNIEELKSR